jgi:hypothetical protein
MEMRLHTYMLDKEILLTSMCYDSRIAIRQHDSLMTADRPDTGPRR